MRNNWRKGVKSSINEIRNASLDANNEVVDGGVEKSVVNKDFDLMADVFGSVKDNSDISVMNHVEQNVGHPESVSILQKLDYSKLSLKQLVINYKDIRSAQKNALNQFIKFKNESKELRELINKKYAERRSRNE